MHPVTPAVKGWKVLAVLLVIAVQQLSDDVAQARDLLAGRGWLLVVGVVVGGALLGFGYSAVAWRMTRYALDDDAVYLHSGVLFRQQRKARLDRLQAVDVVQPILARLLGLAELKLEVAGGPGSAVSLAFLREDQATALRAELLARAAGLRRAEGESAVEAPEQPVIEVPPGLLLAALVRSGSALALVVGVVAVVVIVVTSGGVAGAVVLLPGFLGVGGVFWTQFSRDFNFHAAISPDGIRLRHGLLESRSQTVPPGRVQALRAVQGPLWRRKGWWRVADQRRRLRRLADAARPRTSCCPVGDRDAALTAVWLVLPDLGTDDPRGLLDRRDGRHRRRRRLHDHAPARPLAGPVGLAADRVPGDRAGRCSCAAAGSCAGSSIVPHERTQSLGPAAGSAAAPARRRVLRPALDAGPGQRRRSRTSTPASPRGCSTSRPSAPGPPAPAPARSCGCGRSPTPVRRRERAGRAARAGQPGVPAARAVGAVAARPAGRRRGRRGSRRCGARQRAAVGRAPRRRRERDLRGVPRPDRRAPAGRPGPRGARRRRACRARPAHRARRRPGAPGRGPRAGRRVAGRPARAAHVRDGSASTCSARPGRPVPSRSRCTRP